MTEQQKPHPVTEVQNVDLEAFERAVYSHNHEEASVLLLQSLRRLKSGAEFMHYSVDPSLKPLLYTRFASAVVAMLADPNYSLSEEGMNQFAAEHATTDLVFRASVYGTSDHLLTQVVAEPEERDMAKVRFRDPQSLLKFMLTYSLRSQFGLNFEETFKRSPKITVAFYLGMLSHMLTISKEAQEKREALLQLSGIFDDVEVTDASLPTLSDAYMYCSYSTSENKHDFKAVVHRLMAKMMNLREVPVPSEAEIATRRIAREFHKKPTILIGIEWFTSLHAMYRCWREPIRQLRARFRLVGMGQPVAVDEESKKEFDEWIDVPMDRIALDDLAAKINKVEPDVIFCPSIGMTLWWVALMSARFAPIQVMALGHPASSQSPCVDYVIAHEGEADPVLFTERVVEVQEGTLHHVMRLDADFPLPLDEIGSLSPEVVRVAIPAMLCKLNAPFMASLQRISQEAGSKVEFHFFANMIGTVLYQTAREIREWIPTAFIYERNNYNQYTRYLQRCHLALSTYPFGGANSLVDCFKLGIPIVAMYGDQPHERFDEQMIRRVGLPLWLVGTDEEEYVKAAVRLIDDHAERVRLRDMLLAADVEGTFFGQQQAHSFADAFNAIYDHHEEFQKNDQCNVISIKDDGSYEVRA